MRNKFKSDIFWDSQNAMMNNSVWCMFKAVEVSAVSSSNDSMVLSQCDLIWYKPCDLI